ncbi:MAG: hypothetical protein GXO42_02970 [bacterium]|nr:hypothetical protein [bacterium]
MAYSSKYSAAYLAALVSLCTAAIAALLAQVTCFQQLRFFEQTGLRLELPAFCKILAALGFAGAYILFSWKRRKRIEEALLAAILSVLIFYAFRFSLNSPVFLAVLVFLLVMLVSNCIYAILGALAVLVFLCWKLALVFWPLLCLAYKQRASPRAKRLLPLAAALFAAGSAWKLPLPINITVPLLAALFAVLALAAATRILAVAYIALLAVLASLARPACSLPISYLIIICILIISYIIYLIDACKQKTLSALPAFFLLAELALLAISPAAAVLLIPALCSNLSADRRLLFFQLLLLFGSSLSLYLLARLTGPAIIYRQLLFSASLPKNITQIYASRKTCWLFRFFFPKLRCISVSLQHLPAHGLLLVDFADINVSVLAFYYPVLRRGYLLYFYSPATGSMLVYDERYQELYYPSLAGRLPVACFYYNGSKVISSPSATCYVLVPGAILEVPAAALNNRLFLALLGVPSAGMRPVYVHFPNFYLLALNRSSLYNWYVIVSLAKPAARTLPVFAG